MNYFHGEPYNSDTDKTWSVKLAKIIKGHFGAELEKPILATKKDFEKKRISDESSLSQLALKILTILAIAQSNDQEIGVTAMPNLLSKLGEDKVEANLCLDELLQNKIIGRSYSAYGDAVCHYNNAKAGNEYLRSHAEDVKAMRESLPIRFDDCGPQSARFY